MANEENSKPNQGSGILNEGRTIPLMTPQTGYEERGYSIPLPTPTQSQDSKPEVQPQTESNKSSDK